MSFDFDNPRDNEKLTKLLQEISVLFCDKPELYFLVTWIRVFHEVREDYAKREFGKQPPQMHVVKRNREETFNPALLSNYLVNNGISHAELARQAGLPAAQINDICTGKREATFGEYANICRALQVNFDKFFE